MDLTAFPGGDLVQEGLADLARGAETVPALLVSIGAPRLRRLGLPVPETAAPSPEHRLYEKLRTDVREMIHRGLVDRDELRRRFEQIEPQLYR